MKSFVGAVAVVFLVTSLAVAGSYQPAPFPQEANTALAGGDTGAATEMPASMASQSSQIQVAAGSPFPSVANPSAGADNSDQTTPSEERQHALGSPFPADARP